MPNLPAADSKTIPKGDDAATSWQVDYTGLFYHKRSNILTILEYTLKLGADLLFLHVVYLIHYYLSHTTLLWINELISQQEKYGKGPMLMELTILSCFHHHEATDLLQ